jgi:hypothetical protein
MFWIYTAAFVIDGDHNAALNILKLGLEQSNAENLPLLVHHKKKISKYDYAVWKDNSYESFSHWLSFLHLFQNFIETIMRIIDDLFHARLEHTITVRN